MVMTGRSNNRYNDKAYDRINIAVPKGNKAILQEVANRYGLSVNGYLNKLIDEAMEREGMSQVATGSTEDSIGDGFSFSEG